MPYWTYILRSQSNGRYYCGSTGDLESRVRQHNDPKYRASRTTDLIPGPWELIWSQELPTRSKAMSLEKKIKKRGIARYLGN
ncbi:MAG: GIY-YIG nuclease family protein [Candidatus Zixiibacteriota bacterium]|nr:MAG: GIY-YIG nuclease family protein [candidate division Zixibacteria bacterium]